MPAAYWNVSNQTTYSDEDRLPQALDLGAIQRQTSLLLHGTTSRVVVLDDDPTGTQPVHAVPVIADWRTDDFRWAFAQDSRLVFVLTNSRSLPSAEAARVTAEAATNATIVAAEEGVEISFVSRSDSTLRGHFQVEVAALKAVTSASGRSADAVLLCPAYIEAGRLTIGGEHWIVDASGKRTSVGDTDYAKDATFGFSTSRLADYVAEKSDGNVLTTDVLSISLDDIRVGGVTQVAARIVSATEGKVVAVDAVTYGDLGAVTNALLQLERMGHRFIYRTGPSFPCAYGGVLPRGPLTPAELFPAEPGSYGLTVIGSHVDLSTIQLNRVLESRPRAHVQADASQLLRDVKERYSRRLRDEVIDGLTTGHVVLSTSRDLVTGADGEASLAIARRVSRAMAGIVEGVVGRVPLRYLLAKGGITASDTFTAGLRARKATVLGSILPGMVSVWRPVDGLHPGLAFVVFAGNVGAEHSLAEVLSILEDTQHNANGDDYFTPVYDRSAE